MQDPQPIKAIVYERVSDSGGSVMGVSDVNHLQHSYNTFYLGSKLIYTYISVKNTMPTEKIN